MLPINNLSSVPLFPSTYLYPPKKPRKCAKLNIDYFDLRVGVGNVTWLLGHVTSHLMSQYPENADPPQFHASISTFAAIT